APESRDYDQPPRVIRQSSERSAGRRVLTPDGVYWSERHAQQRPARRIRKLRKRPETGLRNGQEGRRAGRPAPAEPGVRKDASAGLAAQESRHAAKGRAMLNKRCSRS